MKDNRKNAAPAAHGPSGTEDGAVEHMPRMADTKKAAAAPKGSPDGLPRRSMFRDRRPEESE